MQTCTTRSSRRSREPRQENQYYDNTELCLSRNWQQLSPSKEGTALAPILIVGLICSSISLGILALLWHINEEKIAHRDNSISLSAPAQEASKAAHHAHKNSKIHGASLLASSRHGVNHSSRSANEFDIPTANTNSELGNLIAAENSGLDPRVASSESSVDSNNANSMESANNSVPGSSIGSSDNNSANSAGGSTVNSAADAVADSSPNGSNSTKLIPCNSVASSSMCSNSKVSASAKKHNDSASTKVASSKKQKSEQQTDEMVYDATAHRITAKNLLVKVSDDANVHFDKAGLLVLKNGDAVVDSLKPFLIKVGSARVLLKDKNAVVVSMRDGVVKIRNLQEFHAYSTHVFFGNRRFTLCAGQELVAAQSFEHLTEAVSDDAVKRRQVRTFDLADGTNIMCAEFSEVNVIKSTPVLKAMYKSSSKEESKSFGKILKMTACLAIVTRGHGEYAPISSGRDNKLASAAIEQGN